ncbi:MAG: recombinase family protein [Bacteroidia bacterium]|nr:recombinase family protein [Bacteroidia bacterium]
MKDLHAFKQFGLGSDSVADPNNFRTVIYSRVSTKDQEDNTSLANQYETCMRYVERENLEVVAEFGGKGESAKAGGARQEYHRMLKYVMNKRNRIRYVVFYAYDRFSREGGKAIVTKEKLREIGITVKSATMPIDTSNPYGAGMEDMQLILARIENDVRRNRTIDGMKSKLRAGHWCGTAPLGYKWDNGKLVVDPEKGPLIKKAFRWKYENPLLTPKEIKDKWENLGLKVGQNTVQKVLRNPIYCGLLANRLLEGELAEGIHEPLVTQRVFLAVNGILEQQYSSGWKFNKENYETLPLKIFLHCEHCGTPFTGYVSTKKNGKLRKNPLSFYKCRTTGCLSNVSAPKVGELFLDHLNQYTLEKDLVPVVTTELRTTLMEFNEAKLQESKVHEASLQQIESKLERLRERYVMEEEISRSDYDHFTARLLAEKKSILKEIEKTRKISTTLLDKIEDCVQISLNLVHIWENGSYVVKKRLQEMAFPEGMHYSKENHTLRPQRVNEIIRLTSQIGQILKDGRGAKRGVGNGGGMRGTPQHADPDGRLRNAGGWQGHALPLQRIEKEGAHE